MMGAGHKGMKIVTIPEDCTNVAETYNLCVEDPPANGAVLVISTKTAKEIAERNNGIYAMCGIYIDGVRVLGDASRYRDGKFSTAQVATNYDAAVLSGDTYYVQTIEV